MELAQSTRTISEIHARIEAIHEEFERRKRAGLPPPPWEWEPSYTARNLLMAKKRKGKGGC